MMTIKKQDLVDKEIQFYLNQHEPDSTEIFTYL